MNTIVLLVSCCLLFATQAAAQPSTAVTEVEFFARHPVTQAYELSSGHVVSIPFRGQDVETDILLGVIPFNLVRSLLAPEGLYPVGNETLGAIAQVFVNQFKRTCVGPYDEIILGIPSSRTGTITWQDGQDIVAAATQPGVFLYHHKLWLSQQVPINFGREVWGMDKEKYPFQFQVISSAAQERMRVIDPKNNIIIAQLNYTRNNWLVTAPLDVTLYGITSKAVIQKTVAVSIAGPFSLRIWDSTTDSIVFSARNPFTALYVAFQPLVVMYQPHALVAVGVDLQYKHQYKHQ